MESINIFNNSNFESKLKSKLFSSKKNNDDKVLQTKSSNLSAKIIEVDTPSYENKITIHKNDFGTNSNIEFIFKLNLNFETDDKLPSEFEKSYKLFKNKINIFNESLVKKITDFKISDFKINENYLNNYYNELHITYKNINIESEDYTFTIIKNVLQIFKLNIIKQDINISIKNVIGGNITYKEGTINDIIKI